MRKRTGVCIQVRYKYILTLKGPISSSWSSYEVYLFSHTNSIPINLISIFFLTFISLICMRVLFKDCLLRRIGNSQLNAIKT